MDRILEKMKGYKTAIVNGIVVVIGLLVQFGVLGAEVGATVSANMEAFYGGILSVIGIVNLVLRSVTTTPIGESEPVVPGE